MAGPSWFADSQRRIVEKLPAAASAATASMSGASGRSCVTLPTWHETNRVRFLASVPVCSGASKSIPWHAPQQLNRDRMPQINQHALQPPRPAHAHGYVIFLIARSGNRIHRMRCRECFVSLVSAAAVTCATMNRNSARLRRQECPGACCQRIRHLLDATLDDSAERRYRDRHLVRGIASGCPWKFPP